MYILKIIHQIFIFILLETYSMWFELFLHNYDQLQVSGVYIMKDIEDFGTFRL